MESSPQNHLACAQKSIQTGRSLRKLPIHKMAKCWQLYLILLLPVAYVFIFSYIPMYGLTLAFKEFFPNRGILGSPWVGLEYFERFLRAPSSVSIIRNTLVLSFYSLLAGMPCPIILAIALNEVNNQHYKKTVQMITYAPYFISTVIMVSLIMEWLDLRMGIVNQIIRFFGGDAVNFMGRPEYFRSIYVWSGVWQFAGFNSIIYLAALAGIDAELYEAARVDGANKLQKIWHIDLPGITPTIVVLLILNSGQLMSVGFDKVFLMQNNLNTPVSEVISTYTYKIGLVQLNFSYSTAVGFFNSLVNFVLLVFVNFVSKKVSNTSLW